MLTLVQHILTRKYSVHSKIQLINMFGWARFPNMECTLGAYDSSMICMIAQVLTRFQHSTEYWTMQPWWNTVVTETLVKPVLIKTLVHYGSTNPSALTCGISIPQVNAERYTASQRREICRTIEPLPSRTNASVGCLCLFTVTTEYSLLFQE